MAGVQGLRELKSAFKAMGDHFTVKKITAVALAGNAFKNDVQAKAPYKTGTYRRSIHVEIQVAGDEPFALVGTNLPQAKRLEYGYRGPDKLGRTFHQAPRSHFRAAMDANRSRYRQIIEEELLR